jgi:Fe-S oxidoreductase
MSQLRALPLLAPREASLETCVYCPKLCRAACPVSNADPRESLIPWGKMSGVYLEARGDLPIDAEHAALAWACTGCQGCRERCDHRNDVAGTLGDARAAFHERGVSPPAAVAVVEGFGDHEARLIEATAALDAQLPAVEGRPVSLLIGCGYSLHLAEEALAAARATQALLGAPVRLVRRCCGLPLALAGDREGHARALAAIRGEIGGGELIVVDPGCAASLRAGLGPETPVTLLVELAARHLGRLSRVSVEGQVRYHDPCQLGRGLGLYGEPRAVLGKILGQAPAEFDERREHGACSGAGGLLPATMPEVSQEIAGARVGEHEKLGGGEIVTACASSLRAFRRAGARASDLSTWLARALSV